MWPSCHCQNKVLCHKSLSHVSFHAELCSGGACEPRASDLITCRNILLCLDFDTALFVLTCLECRILLYCAAPILFLSLRSPVMYHKGLNLITSCFLLCVIAWFQFFSLVKAPFISTPRPVYTVPARTSLL